MALINKKHVNERDTVNYRLDRATIELVKNYAEFIGSPQEHVVNESLLFVFRKDKEFAEWLKVRNQQDLIPTARRRDDSSEAGSTTSGARIGAVPIATSSKS